MKKLLELIIASVMCISVIACNSVPGTKDVTIYTIKSQNNGLDIANRFSEFVQNRQFDSINNFMESHSAGYQKSTTNVFYSTIDKSRIVVDSTRTRKPNAITEKRIENVYVYKFETDSTYGDYELAMCKSKSGEYYVFAWNINVQFKNKNIQ